MWAELLPFQFPVAAILDFVYNGHQGSPPICYRVTKTFTSRWQAVEILPGHPEIARVKFK